MDAAVSSLLVPPRPPPAQREPTLLPFLRAIRCNALTMWTERAYQEPVLVSRLLIRANVLLNDPGAIHRVLVENPGNYRRSPASIRILRPIAGNGLLLSEGEAWRHQRRIIAPALAPRVLPILARHIVATAKEQVTALEAQADRPVDLLAAMQALSLEIAGRSMFSLEMRQFGAAMRRLLAEYAVELAQPKLFDMLLPASVPTLRDLRRRRFRLRWMRLMQSVMQARMDVASAEPPRDLFDLLRTARDPESGQAFTLEQLRDQFATLIVAGYETTAVTLFWALALLAQDVDEQQRVAAEAAAVSIEPESAMAALPRLVRTRAVISETLRLYPPAFTVVREAIGPDQLGTLRLPRGSVVMIAPWVLHRHRRLWRDPDAFDPSRFMPSGSTPDTGAAASPPRFAYLPFGAGPRVCVGAQFALTEATLVLAMLMQRFRVTLVDAAPCPAAVVTTQPERPALVCLAVR